MATPQTKEMAFEDCLETHLLSDAGGYVKGDRLTKSLPWLEPKLADARVSRAAADGKFTTNGEQRSKRRIEPHTFDTWLLEHREKDLAEDDAII